MAATETYMKKSELIELLKGKIEVPETELTQLSRNQLLQYWNDVRASEILSSATLEEPPVATQISLPENLLENSNPIEAVSEPKNIPFPTDPEWSDYVRTLFTEDELIDGHPTCDGLRRVFEVLMGEIISCNVEVLQTPVISNLNRATVKCTIRFTDYRSRILKEVSDAADCFNGNSQSPYFLYPTATASTMAEGRALRKAMKFKTLTSEEAVNKPDQENIDISQNSTPGTDVQKNAIRTRADKCKIDVDKLLISMNPMIKATNLIDITYTDAQLVMKQLSSYDKGPEYGGEKIPENIIKVS